MLTATDNLEPAVDHSLSIAHEYLDHLNNSLRGHGQIDVGINGVFGNGLIIQNSNPR